MGIGLHLSEIVSDLIEAMVGRILGGREVISVEDMLAMVDRLNLDNEGWSPNSWWEGKTSGNYVACGVCVGNPNIVWDDNNPELCTCQQNEGEITCGKSLEKTHRNPDSQESAKTSPNVDMVAATGATRNTSNFVRTRRRVAWEMEMDWVEEDLDRMVDSVEALPEDLQDYKIPMVVIGSDVVNLYPSLDTDKVKEAMGEFIREADIKWSNVDLLECARYLALNMTEEQARSSPLKRILPWRRGKRGTRPGMRGEGPRGREKGDQEQWEFPSVVIEAWERELLIIEVVKIAVKTMFSKHYYTFGGKKFHQSRGGPIGLRGTCAIARAIMQLFDIKWEQRLENLMVKIWLNSRYMDDGRLFLPPFRRGWRWENGKILYCKRWEREDWELGPEEITKSIISGTLEGIESYLKFTTEVGTEFMGGWLPTLDTSLKVEGNNKIKYKFYEKPEGAKSTVHFKTAMGENTKNQILSQEMVRRLLNTSEDLEGEHLIEITDNYAKKLHNSGYQRDHIRKIILAGVKGYGAKLRRSKEQETPLRRTSEESEGARTRTKLIGKSTWFKKKRSSQGSKTGSRRNGGPPGKGAMEHPTSTPSTVLFVEQTPDGKLASKLRELLTRLEPTLGFKIKVVEKIGASLRSKFPLYNLWEGALCGREQCIPCSQGAEFVQQCTANSVVHENICKTCNPEAGGKREVEVVEDRVPTAYIGETSRSIMERTKEHWEAYRNRNKESHLHKHQEMEHEGAPPEFIMRVVGRAKSALERQTKEAVRIRRRGGEGAILNSKAEFNRCFIPRLQLQEQKVVEELEEEERKQEEETERELRNTQEQWEQEKVKERRDQRRNIVKGLPKRIQDRELGLNRKREQERNDKGAGSRSKRRKYALIGAGWGEQKTSSLGEERGVAGGGPPRGSFFSIKRTLLYSYRKGTHQ